MSATIRVEPPKRINITKRILVECIRAHLCAGSIQEKRQSLRRLHIKHGETVCGHGGIFRELWNGVSHIRSRAMKRMPARTCLLLLSSHLAVCMVFPASLVPFLTPFPISLYFSLYLFYSLFPSAILSHKFDPLFPLSLILIFSHSLSFSHVCPLSFIRFCSPYSLSFSHSVSVSLSFFIHPRST